MFKNRQRLSLKIKQNIISESTYPIVLFETCMCKPRFYFVLSYHGTLKENHSSDTHDFPLTGYHANQTAQLF